MTVTLKLPHFCGLLHVHSLHFMLSIESLDVKIIRICSQNFGFKVINLLFCCCFFLTWINAGTFCGVFRRQALDRGAMALKVDKIVTGKKCLSCICKFIAANYSAEAWWENFYPKQYLLAQKPWFLLHNLYVMCRSDVQVTCFCSFHFIKLYSTTYM